MKKILASIILSLASINAAQSHTHLVSSEPAENSILMEAPKTLMLQFGKPVTLTSLALYKREMKLQELMLPKDANTKFNFSMPAKLDAGMYTVKFRGLSDDQHFMSGQLNFTLRVKPAKTP